MAKLKGGLIQMSLKGDTSMSPEQIRRRTIRNNWRFFRDRRPETYGSLADIGR